MQIREFQITDYNEIVGLWKSSGLIQRPGDDLDGIKQKLQRDPELFLVAEDGDDIVGVVMGAWDGRRGWINHLAVKANRRREGIGGALVGELERRLFGKGAKKINAQIYQWNSNSLEFFKSIGYQVHSDLLMIGKYLRE